MLKIGDEVYIHGYIDEIRKDTVIIRNNGGYFGTIPSEVITGELPSAQPNTIPMDWIQRYADDWEDIGYAYENPILGMLEDWREEQDDS